MGRRVAPEAFFWMLHVGIFVVWFPTVFVAQRLVGNVNRKDLWKIVLRDSPDWMRYMVYGFFGYAMVNFLFFMTKAPSGGSGRQPSSGGLERILGTLDGVLFGCTCDPLLLVPRIQARAVPTDKWHCRMRPTARAAANLCCEFAKIGAI